MPLVMVAMISQAVRPMEKNREIKILALACAITLSGCSTAAVRAGAARPARPVVTLLAYFTPAAAEKLGGPKAARAKIQSQVDQCNAALARSRIKGEIRLVRTLGLPGYAETTSAKTELDRLMGTGDKHLDFVHRTRDQLRADLVTLVGGRKWTDAGGLAPLPDPPTRGPNGTAKKGFNVINQGKFGVLGLCHEIGHNLGAVHDMATTPRMSKAFPNNHGYIEPGGKWRDIMAAAAPCGGCKRVPYYSNARIRYPGDNKLMGMRGSPKYSDIASVFERTLPIIATYRN